MSNNINKVALVTCYFQHNYGSQLQALATQMAFDKMGIENETIRIDGLRKEINHAKYLYFLSKILDWQTVKDKMATVRKVFAKRTNKHYATNLAKRDALFTRFANEKFRLSQIYRSKAELSANAHRYKAFVVGSDQLWLPSNIAADYYTLNFVPDDIRKIAYATSFGVSSLPAKYAMKAKQFLTRFQSIMLREQSGQKIVKALTGNDAPLVCDPTLLFSAQEWNSILSQKHRIPESYILCYFLGNNPQQRTFAKKLAHERGLKIVQLPHLDEYVRTDVGFADYPLYDVDPLDFVALIRDASVVLTDSFHCTVFSNLFAKEFYTFRRYHDDGTASTNSRLYSLLDTLGESDRMLTGTEDINHLPSINFEQVHTTISTLRDKSFNLLADSLADA